MSSPRANDRCLWRRDSDTGRRYPHTTPVMATTTNVPAARPAARGPPRGRGALRAAGVGPHRPGVARAGEKEVARGHDVVGPNVRRDHRWGAAYGHRVLRFCRATRVGESEQLPVEREDVCFGRS
eukprot:CAMPEP_0198681448 /NCGR_PEP_ID=MMETSP1468-20131203/6814_1 /TAXON_ID=1461545 /ORGANISM="Mantoniella sp, Strain CCMP1436" /LENGTH=124 /DNA_ID=CAMNT_0044423153 /DNA_START=168 /DNA_END=540 /DNA_ORIENTATION=+